MSITIQHQSTYNDHDVYDVTFYDHTIQTSVTSSSDFVASWIRRIECIHHYRLRNLVVGLDIEWRPNNRRYPSNPVSVLQLCVGHLCLVFKLRYADGLPQALVDFLGDGNYTFVGVGIHGDAQKLRGDFGLEVSNMVDLRDLASARLDNPEVYNMGLAALGNEVLCLEYNKNKNITLSDWSQPVLSPAQVAYAAVDAFLSFEIGKCLNAAHFE